VSLISLDPGIRLTSRGVGQLCAHCNCTSLTVLIKRVLKRCMAQTDEQAPLPVALSQLLERVQSGYASANEFVFNCQMGRGRTTTGMVTACLIATTMNWKQFREEDEQKEERGSDGEEPPSSEEYLDSMDGLSEEEAYLQGE
jgi:hypothetical protein